MALSKRLFSLALVAVFPACGGTTPPVVTPPPPPLATSAPAPPVAPAASAPPVPPESPKPVSPSVVAKYSGFATPESVLYDADSDRYLVSNINGKPSDLDNNGFISVLSPDGQVTTLKWIEGGKGKVKLNAPKGMGLVKDVLYVADISTVRMFDAKTGSPKGEVAIAGSTFLNDIATGPDGRVYVSDSGFKFGANGPEPTKTDAVYVIEKGHAKPISKSTDLGNPNGLLVTDKGVLVATFGSGELYRLDDKGAKLDVTKPPFGGLDGLVAVGDSFLVSSWAGSAIYRGKLGGTFETILTDQKSPADIGYDSKRGRVLVPHFTEDTVEAYEVK